MKKYLILAIALALIFVIALPFAQRIGSVRTLESKVRDATVGMGLKELPESLALRVEGTDWYLAGYGCPYSPYKYSLNPNTGILGDYTLTIPRENYNALFFLNLDRQVTYVELERSHLDLCDVDSIEPNIAIID